MGDFENIFASLDDLIHHVGIVSTRFVLVFDLDQARIDIYKEITIRDGNDPDQCRCLTLFDAFQLVQLSIVV